MRLIDADALKENQYDSRQWKDAEHGYHQMVVDVEDIDEAPTIISVRCDLHCNSCYGVYEVLYHEPTEEMQFEIKKRLAEKLLPALMDEMMVIRCHYPAGERNPDDPRESWTYAVKFMICRAFGEPDIDREDKSFDERGPTAMMKAIGIAIPEPHDGEPGEVLKLV